MTQRGPAEEAEFEAKSRTGSKREDEMSELPDDLKILSSRRSRGLDQNARMKCPN
jgi:hypothetical protein